MGCPLLDQQQQALGAIVLQSYLPEHAFSDEDQVLFALLANHVSNALQGMQSMDRLERAVQQRTVMLEQQNAALSTAMAALREAQSELVRQEKLASLGRLVAGVAHEINTPLGICVTATSHLVQELKLTRFKQVAVDQSSDDMPSFNLNTYLHEVLLSLQPKLKGRPVKVAIDCAPDIVLDSFPGVLSQILTNMLVNSLVHGFEHEQAGSIVVSAALEGETVVFDYRDDGAGMAAGTLAKLFDPFFTTRRGSGGSGLGAHILYNLVTGPLGGTVKVDSAPGQGLRYRLRFPRSRRKEAVAR